MRVVKLMAVVAVASALMLAGMSTAQARRTFSSDIGRISDTTSGGNVVAVSGTVFTAKAACKANRTVRVRLNDVAVAFGTATTDGNGNFAAAGFGPRDVDYRISVSAVRRGGFICGADSVVVELG